MITISKRDNKIVVARYFAFALLVAPTLGWFSAILVFTLAFGDLDKGMLYGDFGGLTVGLAAGIVSGWIPARGNMIAFSLVVLLSTTIPLCALVKFVGYGIVPLSPVFYLAGVYMYYHFLESEPRSGGVS